MYLYSAWLLFIATYIAFCALLCPVFSLFLKALLELSVRGVVSSEVLALVNNAAGSWWMLWKRILLKCNMQGRRLNDNQEMDIAKTYSELVIFFVVGNIPRIMK